MDNAAIRIDMVHYNLHDYRKRNKKNILGGTIMKYILILLFIFTVVLTFITIHFRNQYIIEQRNEKLLNHSEITFKTLAGNE